MKSGRNSHAKVKGVGGDRKGSSKKGKYSDDDSGDDLFYEDDSPDEHSGTNAKHTKAKRAKVEKQGMSNPRIRKSQEPAREYDFDVRPTLAQKIELIDPVIDVEAIGCDTLMDIYEDAVQFVKKIDLLGFFAAPVNEDIAPGYFQIISNPMDLSTIATKVSTGSYRCFEELGDDMILMFQNCLMYNADGTKISIVS